VGLSLHGDSNSQIPAFYVEDGSSRQMEFVKTDEGIYGQ